MKNSMEFPGSKKWFENKKLEQKRNPEVFRASIGFDFIFHYDESGEIKCKCLELNGHNTGVFGVSEIKDGKFDKLKKILSSIRAQYSDEALRDNQYMREMAENRKIGWYPYDKRFHDRVNRYIAGSKYKRKIIKHSYTAPRNLEMIFGDKVLLPDLIPEEYRIRQFSISELSAQPFVLPKDISSDDILIFKPALGIQGKGIGFSTAEEFQDVMNSNDEFRHAILVKYVVQKFIKSKGADNSISENLNKQSMRLLWDVRVFTSGDFEVDFESGYQRVSSGIVVNKKLGARSVTASEREFELARKAATEILKRIIEVQKSDMLKKNTTFPHT
jgi:hypothetical protein